MLLSLCVCACHGCWPALHRRHRGTLFSQPVQPSLAHRHSHRLRLLQRRSSISLWVHVRVTAPPPPSTALLLHSRPLRRCTCPRRLLHRASAPSAATHTSHGSFSLSFLASITPVSLLQRCAPTSSALPRILLFGPLCRPLASTLPRVHAAPPPTLSLSGIDEATALRCGAAASVRGTKSRHGGSAQRH